ncbi:MAG: DNA repair protein RecO C-terminal domain-containing protein [Bacteroidales bacterium]|nr:DNA repair protein RecO C-terminal domain-containing protein [Bacteroidales bacterium]
MKYRCSFIVLNTTRVGDNSLVLHTLSSDWGRRSFICRSGRSMGLYQPLSLLEGEITENPKSDLWRVSGISALSALQGIRNNLYKTSIAVFMSEVLWRTVKDGANEDGLYEWCSSSIRTLDALPGNAANYHLRWLLEFAGALGFSPSAADIAPFAGTWLQTIRQLIELPEAGALLLPLSGNARAAIAEILLKYIGHHTESNINIRSLNILQEIFK